MTPAMVSICFHLPHLFCIYVFRSNLHFCSMTVFFLCGPVEEEDSAYGPDPADVFTF